MKYKLWRIADFVNNREKQMIRESKFMENFLKQKEIFVDDIIHLKIDPPDFVLNKEGNYIGVEIVELWPKINSKPTVSAYEKVIKIAESQFLNLSNQPLSLSFTFRGNLDTHKGQDIELGDIIAKWVRDVLIYEIDVLNKNYTFSDPLLEIPELIEIKYYAYNNRNISNWHLSMELNFCLPISSNEVNDLITKKQNQIKGWNKEYNFFEKWLLIVITEDPQSTFLNHQQKIDNWNSDGLFDEIFIFDDFMRELIN
jgi:hypothetical protein